MMSEVESILRAMKATDIPIGRSGLWHIEALEMKPHICAIAKSEQGRDVDPGDTRFLRRLTETTCVDGGEVVMEDTRHELRRHMEFILSARGRVLVTGLGLGCVVRGLLTRSAVESIDVIEASWDVLTLVEPYMPADPRLTIHYDDAQRFIAGLHRYDRWDCAWHDIWTDRDNGEPHLDLVHSRMMIKLRRHVPIQGAWALRRWMRRQMQRCGMEVL